MEILGVSEVAKLLKLDPQTVSRKAQRGEIPGFKIGNRWRFRRSDLEDWISEKVAYISNKTTPYRQILLDKLSAFFKKRDDINLAYLFGSQATAKAGKISDIDIAILLKGETKLNLDFKTEITSELMSLLSVNKIDVVFLNNATPLMRYEVIKDGKVIFSDPDFDLTDYKISVIREYLDTEHLRTVRYEYFLKAVNA